MAKNYEYKSGNLIARATDENNIWDSKWDVFLVDKDNDNTKIGWVSFEGEKYAGIVPISVEIEKSFRGRGFGTAVFKMMKEWAFLHSNIYVVEAFADKENTALISSLEKSGFVYREGQSIEKGGVEKYSVIREKTSWLGLYFIIGIIVGVLLGIVIGSVWIGFAISMIIALSIGFVMDHNENKKREEMMGEYYSYGKKKH
ncbi:MAG: GNAT family N-acetyltransferase [Lachnospiraceae bacterium]|nr:GNAT family N-acetyltransferase [Lachnospiraceae bacterium]MBR1649769.1 GNAT family N-acetyltransferase [Lachnospiraceae bacterium]